MSTTLAYQYWVIHNWMVAHSNWGLFILFIAFCVTLAVYMERSKGYDLD